MDTMTRNEAAAVLRVSNAMIAKWVRNGVLETVHLETSSWERWKGLARKVVLTRITKSSVDALYLVELKRFGELRYGRRRANT